MNHLPTEIPSNRRRTTLPLAIVTLSGVLASTWALAAPGRDPVVAGKNDVTKGAKSDPKTRAEMAHIFAAMRVLLPLSVDATVFSSAAKKGVIEKELTRLSTHAEVLSAHVDGEGPGQRFLGRTLMRDASEVGRHFRAGRADNARFLLQEMTDTCIACHARLPADIDSPLSDAFVSTTTLNGLPDGAKARLLIATRRFDDALQLYEKVLVDKSVPASQLLDPLSHYLTTSIRVKGDFDRPKATLEKFQARSDVWRALRRDTQQWIVSLAEMKRYSTTKPDLKTARRLIDDATNLIAFRADRTGLIHVITASSLLFRFVNDDGHTDAELAEAYYFLGVAESFIRQNYWLEEAEAFLEISIRLHPRGPWAEYALAKLEEELIFTYTGSSGQTLPDDVDRRLDELRALVETKLDVKSEKPKPAPAKK